jgi:caspase domain-containing protein
MDKLFEQVLKYLPAEVIPVALAAAAAFFGIYYYKAFRSYTDVLHDSFFLSAIVIIAAAALVYHFNRTEVLTSLEAGSSPILLVPEFVDDERGQFKTLFVQQVGSAIQAIAKRDKTVLTLNSFLLDQDSARLTAQRYKAIAVIYGPKIVRVGEKVYICFNLLRVDPDVSKPYPPSTVELDKQVLNDITETLAITNSETQAKLGTSLSRLDVLEKRVGDLELALTKLAAPETPRTAELQYKRKRAIVVGVDQHKAGNLPSLQYSISDAKRMASQLRAYGFDVTVLENPTSASIEQALAEETSVGTPDDLFLFYYAGNGIRTDELKIPGEPSLILGTFDVDLQDSKKISPCQS